MHSPRWNRARESEDEQGYAVSGRNVVKNHQMYKGTQSPGRPWKKKAEDEQGYTDIVTKSDPMHRGS